MMPRSGDRGNAGEPTFLERAMGAASMMPRSGDRGNNPPEHGAGYGTLRFNDAAIRGSRKCCATPNEKTSGHGASMMPRSGDRGNDGGIPHGMNRRGWLQ